MTTKNQRILIGANVLNVLARTVIVSLGATKLNIEGTGQPFTREDGTAIHIFNVNAFSSVEAAKAAMESWKLGAKLEKAGDSDGAQEHLRKALNGRMSFSVLAENAAPFTSAYELTCFVEDIKNAEGKIVRVINKPRAVAVVANNSTAASIFTIAAAPKATKPAGTRKKAATTTP